MAVQLAGSDFDRGQTYLAQAQEHISDARDLTDQPTRPGVGEVNLALRQAIDSVRQGQRSLDAAYAQNGNPQALIAMRDFTARALPQVEALRIEVQDGLVRVTRTDGRPVLEPDLADACTDLQRMHEQIRQDAYVWVHRSRGPILAVLHEAVEPKIQRMADSLLAEICR